MSKREVIKIIESFGYIKTPHCDEWVSEPYDMKFQYGCISFCKEKKRNFIKFHYGEALPLSDFTIDILFSYMVEKSPYLKDKVRDYKLSKILG